MGTLCILVSRICGVSASYSLAKGEVDLLDRLESNASQSSENATSAANNKRNFAICDLTFAIILLFINIILIHFSLVGFSGTMVTTCIALMLLAHAKNRIAPWLAQQGSFRVLLILFLVLGFGLASFLAQPQVIDDAARSEPLLTPPLDGSIHWNAGLTANVTYPICSLSWGHPSMPPQKRLGVLDLAAFSASTYEPDYSAVLDFIRNATSSTDLEDVMIEVLSKWQVIARYGIFTIPSMKVRILAFRGTSTNDDIMADASLFAQIFVLQVFDIILPIFSIFPKAMIRNMMDPVGGKRLLGGDVGLDEIVQLAEELKARSLAEGYQLVITGHSLGGVVAAIAGARAHVPAVSFSPPGQFYTMGRFGFTEQEVESSLVLVQPHWDVVPKVDRQAGFGQWVKCNESPLQCHSIWRTTGTLYKNCGDPRERVLNTDEGEA